MVIFILDYMSLDNKSRLWLLLNVLSDKKNIKLLINN